MKLELRNSDFSKNTKFLGLNSVYGFNMVGLNVLIKGYKTIMFLSKLLNYQNGNLMKVKFSDVTVKTVLKTDNIITDMITYDM